MFRLDEIRWLALEEPDEREVEARPEETAMAGMILHDAAAPPTPPADRNNRAGRWRNRPARR